MDRRGLACRLFRCGTLVAVLVASAGAGARLPGAEAGGPPFSLSDAAQQGTFNVGAAQVSIGHVSERGVGDVLELTYTVPQGTAAGVWSKEFPARLNPGEVDMVRLGLKGIDPDQ